MRLVPSPPAASAAAARDPLETFVGAQLMVLFADADELRHARARSHGGIRLAAGYSLSEDDTYLVLPDDIGEEIADIFRDADQELLEEALEEALLVHGEFQRGHGGAPVLAAEFAVSVADALRGGLDYATQLALAEEADPILRLNTLDHVQCTLVSALVDGEGLSKVLSESTHLGVSWRPPSDAPGLRYLAPTYVFSRHTGPGEVGLELALFSEDDDLVALARPAQLLAQPVG